MKHTLKYSFIIGTSTAGIVIFLMKMFQPITFLHIVFFCYAIVVSAVAAGLVSHKKLEKRFNENSAKQNSANEQKNAFHANTDENDRKTCNQEIYADNKENMPEKYIEQEQQNHSKEEKIYEHEHFMHKGKMATLHTKDGKSYRGRFLSLDGMHIIMDYAHTGDKIASMIVLEKEIIKMLEVD